MPKPKVKVRIGIKSVDKKLAQLPNAVAKKVIRQSIRQSLKGVQSAAKSNAPIDTGRLRKEIVVRAAKKRKRNRIAMFVRSIAKAPKDPTHPKPKFYAAFVEYGYKLTRRTADGGKRVIRKIAGRHFMESAYKSKGKAARDQCIKLIRRGVDDVVRQLRKGG